MAIGIISPKHSFVRFNEAEPAPLCIWGSVDYCLPVYDEADVAFQWVMTGTEAEMDALCVIGGGELQIDLVTDCGELPLIELTDRPQRFRLSATQVLYNWPHGFPGFTTVVAENKCFRVQLTYGYFTTCSNCFERVPSDCFTSVIEYGNEADSFGFKYCYGGGVETSGEDVVDNCDPTIVTFIGISELEIPYTALLKSKYGPVPQVQVWLSDGIGQLVNSGIFASFDGVPVNMINLDFGGTASGIVVIR